MTTPLSGELGAYAAKKGRQAARDAGRARIPTGNRQYQGVILAEFLAAVLIVALAPIARGKESTSDPSSPSPYGPDDIKQLVGVGAVYFVLALLSSGKWGRLSAWFGGLVLIAIGLAETTSGGLPAIFGIFQPSSKSAGPETTPGQLQQEFNQAAAAAAAGANVYPTQQQVFQQAGQAAQSGAQFYTFTQPGVITTTEASPGATIK